MDQQVTAAGALVVTTDQTKVSAASTLLVAGKRTHDIVVSAAGLTAVSDLAIYPTRVSASGLMIVLADFDPTDWTTHEVTDDNYAVEEAQTFIVPADLTDIEFRIWGASGGSGQGYSEGGVQLSGGAACVTGHLAVVEGDVLTIEIGRGGFSADAGAGLVGEGGWPNGTAGVYNRRHNSYGGGQGGSTRLFLNGTLVAEAGGSAGTGGYPGTLSEVGADYAYVSPLVNSGKTHFSTSEVPANQEEAPEFNRCGWGIINLAVDASPLGVRGNPGLCFLKYVTPGTTG